MSEGFAPGSTRDRGARAESYVVELARERGLTVLARNVEAAGVEIDIVAKQPGQPDIYVFIEVRSRADNARGRPVETVGPAKQARLIKGATAWLVDEGLWERVQVRFDVVGVTWPDEQAPEIEWIAGAFEVDG